MGTHPEINVGIEYSQQLKDSLKEKGVSKIRYGSSGASGFDCYACIPEGTTMELMPLDNKQ